MTLHLPHVKMVGTKWTSTSPFFGWNHFVVVTIQKKNNCWMLEMAAICDKKIRFWITKLELQDANKWSPGWLQKDCINL